MQPDLLEDENPEMNEMGEDAHLLNSNLKILIVSDIITKYSICFFFLLASFHLSMLYFQTGETRTERHCDGDAGTNLQSVPSYPSWVSRRFNRTTNHASYAESESNGGPSVNQFLMYRGSADPTCSYATPMDSNGLSMPDMEGRLTHGDEGNVNSQSERSPFTPCFTFKQSDSPQMQRKDKFV